MNDGHASWCSPDEECDMPIHEWTRGYGHEPINVPGGQMCGKCEESWPCNNVAPILLPSSPVIVELNSAILDMTDQNKRLLDVLAVLANRTDSLPDWAEPMLAPYRRFE
jgi:hypothetical protein